MNIGKLSKLISIIAFRERFNKNEKPNAIKHKANYIMVFEKISETPKKYPRLFGQIKNKPL